MNAISKSLLLFVMNWLDAQLTILWIRLHIASEGNGAMARLLNLGEAPFLAAKLTIGAFAAYTLYRCAHMTLARRGMKLVLGIYCALMCIHAATGSRQRAEEPRPRHRLSNQARGSGLSNRARGLSPGGEPLIPARTVGAPVPANKNG